MVIAPTVYLGPSLPRDQALRLFPGARIQPPIRRGDLYRDRSLQFGFFVIIDGAFLHQQAVSPREVIDVIRDGAVVIGAASMGALRAADCWPAGMQGIGAIFRLFRAGRLTSDDEVAVTFRSTAPHRPSSVALVNVRYAASRAVRSQRLSPAQASRMVSAAVETFYADRTWPAILERAGLHGAGPLRPWLEQQDLKARDATRVLQHAAAMLASNRRLAYRPRGRRPLLLGNAEEREREHQPLAGMESARARAAVGRWYFASGRYVRHLPGLLRHPTDGARTPGLRPTAASPDGLRDFFERRGRTDPESRRAWMADRGVRGAMLRRTVGRPEALEQLWRSLAAREAKWIELLWSELVHEDEADAAAFRWRSLQDAAALARAQGWTSTSSARLLVEARLALQHGFRGWDELRDALSPHQPLWSWVLAHRDELALAARVRASLFSDRWWDLAARPPR